MSERGPSLASPLTSPWEVPAHRALSLAPRSSRYCLMIPVLNEDRRIGRQLARMKSTVQGVDILLSDGGSTDGSLDDHAALADANVKAILVDESDGRYSAGARIGFAHALYLGYEGVITIDGNDKDGEEAVSDFVAALDEGVDFVQGSRFLPGGFHRNTPWARELGIRFIASPVVSHAAGERYTDVTNGFKAYSRKLLLHPGMQIFRDVFNRYELIFYVGARAPRLGLRTREVPVRREYPDGGEVPTKVSFAGNFEHLKVFYEVWRGRYDPEG